MTRKPILPVGRLELIAFVIGFCLLSYELVAARLLAPYIGSSVYVWTSVIGIIILALSLGYAFGGRLADRRVAPVDIACLLLVAVGGVGITLVTYTPLLEIIVLTVADPRLQGFIASLVLFAPTSFVLGSISPYLARLRLKSVTTTGRVVAGLSAINSLGGITGTFVTGFILLGYIGSNQILIILILTLTLLSWVMVPRMRQMERLVITVAVLIAIIFFIKPNLPPSVLADIDTPSTHYRVQAATNMKDSFRVLITGPGAWQSASLNNGSSRLVFWYAKQVAAMVAQAPRHDSILILGAGAFSLPRYFNETYPNAHITVVDIDSELPEISEKYFHYKPNKNISAVSSDARMFLEKNNKKYDVVVVDAFSDSTVPFSLTTKEYAAALGKATHKESRVVVNLIVSSKGACSELFSGIDGSYKKSFAYGSYSNEAKKELSVRQNIVAVYANQPLVGSIQARTLSAQSRTQQSFSDNFSPTDRLNFECQIQKS